MFGNIIFDSIFTSANNHNQRDRQLYNMAKIIMKTQILFSARHENVSRSGLYCLDTNATLDDLATAINGYSDDFYGKCQIFEDEGEFFESIKSHIFEGALYEYNASGCKNLYTKKYMAANLLSFSGAGLYFEFEYIGEKLNCGDETIYLKDVTELTELELGVCFDSLSREDQLVVADYYCTQSDMLSNGEFATVINMKMPDYKHGGGYTISIERFCFNNNIYDNLQDIEEFINEIEA